MQCFEVIYRTIKGRQFTSAYVTASGFQDAIIQADIYMRREFPNVLTRSAPECVRQQSGFSDI